MYVFLPQQGPRTFALVRLLASPASAVGSERPLNPSRRMDCQLLKPISTNQMPHHAARSIMGEPESTTVQTLSPPPPPVSGQRVPAGMSMLPNRWHPAAAHRPRPPCRRLHQADLVAPSAPVPTSHHMSSVLSGGVSPSRSGTCRGNVIPPHSPTPRCDAESQSGEQLGQQAWLSLALLTGLPTFVDGTPYW